MGRRLDGGHRTAGDRQGQWEVSETFLRFQCLVADRERGQGVVGVKSSWLDSHLRSFPPGRGPSMQRTFRRNLSALVSRKISGN